MRTLVLPPSLRLFCCRRLGARSPTKVNQVCHPVRVGFSQRHPGAHHRSRIRAIHGPAGHRFKSPLADGAGAGIEVKRSALDRDIDRRH
jgi:hypothetical protein